MSKNNIFLSILLIFKGHSLHCTSVSELWNRFKDNSQAISTVITIIGGTATVYW